MTMTKTKTMKGSSSPAPQPGWIIVVVATILALTTLSKPVHAISNSNTINEIITDQRRFVLFNSRRLTGECLPICIDEGVTTTPTTSPTTDAPTYEQTGDIGQLAIGTATPTSFPTSFPTYEQTGNIEELRAGTDAPTYEMTGDIEELAIGNNDAAMEGCYCPVNNQESDMSWKCGNDIYVCPDVERICSVQASRNSVYYSITKDQCDAMRSVEIGQKCIQLPQHRISKPKGLSNRVCYKDGGLGFHGMKNDGNCDSCRDSIPNPAK